MANMRIVVVFLLAACGSITNPAGPVYPPGGAPPVDGYEYCQMISDSARVRASRTSVYGYILSAVGGMASAAGTAFPLVKSDELHFEQKFGSALTVASGATLYLLGQAVLKRSDAASKLAGEAAAVLGERIEVDGKKVRISAEEAGQKCSTALAAWESSRTDATAIASKLLEDKKGQLKESESKAVNARNQAKSAKEEADAKDKKLDEIRELFKNCPAERCSDRQLLEIQQRLFK